MNQILLTTIKKIKNNKIKFKIILSISLILIPVSILYYLYMYKFSNGNQNISLFLLNKYNVEKLYSNKNNYTLLSLNNNDSFFIIGTIEIPSIEINYPIISNATDELLKIAPCRFYGPLPNKIGNMCVAAHNFNDNRFFGNLYRLNIGDKINIFDSYNSEVSYYIYDKYEVNKADTSCTLQNTSGKREITLVTCNNYNGNRLIIKAKE